jgi:hypothetical protein
MVVKSPHTFLSTICIAAAHLDAIHDRSIESVQTLALRQEVIHLIGQSLVNPNSRVDDHNVIALTQLIASEIISGEETALNFHESGVEAMVKQRGGVKELGANGRIASTISWVSLLSAITREAKPASMYADWCTSASSKTYPNTATIPESPLFCPRDDFQTVKRSKRCSPRLLELLRDIRMMTDLFLHETEHSRQNAQSLKNLHKKITTNYSSVAELQKTNVLTRSDWTYEAIRVAATLQATSIMKRQPLSEALKAYAQQQDPTPVYTSINNSNSPTTVTLRHDSLTTRHSTSPSQETSPAFPVNPFTFIPSNSRPSVSSTHRTSSASTASNQRNSSLASSSTTNHSSKYFPTTPTTPSGPTALLTNLKTAISNSDISDCWDEMAGVLLWISLTASAASRNSNKVQRKWFNALAMRCSIVLCFEHQEPVHASLARMGEIIEAVGFRSTGGEVSSDSMSRSGSGSGSASGSTEAKRRRT